MGQQCCCNNQQQNHHKQQPKPTNFTNNNNNNQQPTTTTTTNNQQPTTTTNNQQPTTNNQQPTTTTNNQQPTTNNQQQQQTNNPVWFRLARRVCYLCAVYCGFSPSAIGKPSTKHHQLPALEKHQQPAPPTTNNQQVSTARLPLRLRLVRENIMKYNILCCIRC